MSKVKAGCPELRKVLRRYPGYTLQPTGSGGHQNLIGPDRKPVRIADGRPLRIVSSPQNGHDEVRELVRRLESLGIHQKGVAA
jgi:hypothetical protein